MSFLANRLKKNFTHLMKWAKRTNSNCFRIYDRDIKEFPLIIDFYDGHFVAYYLEFAQDEDCKFSRIEEAVSEAVFQLDGKKEKIIWKRRYKRNELEQYEKQDSLNESIVVIENGVRFKVNLHDYLDTGLFLDHRETRQRVANCASGKKLLNLFSYTCSFSVFAALKGAQTKSVDLSNTYLAWGEENFVLNNLKTASHQFVRADCLTYLDQEKELFDVIIIDPPTISRSKKMKEMFDVQKDHYFLLTKALKLLAPNGTLFFSTNCRTFKLDPRLKATDITSKTIPWGFHKPHQSYQITNPLPVPVPLPVPDLFFPLKY